MTIIKASTKKGYTMMINAMRIEATTLNQIYGRCSNAKRQAFENCLRMCHDEGGKAFGICSHNSNFFSVSWLVENGVRLETGKNSYLILKPEFC